MLLAVLLSAALVQASSSGTFDDGRPWSVIELHGIKYRFPKDRENAWQVWSTAAHIELPGWFWHSILGQIGLVDGWQQMADWSAIYLTEPNDLFSWVTPSVPLGPPVPEKVKLEEVRGAMRLWGSRGRYGAQNLVLVTYERHPNLYVQCDRLAVDQSTKACDLNWFDGGIIHSLGLAGNWLDKAPALVERYSAAVKMR